MFDCTKLLKISLKLKKKMEKIDSQKAKKITKKFEKKCKKICKKCVYNCNLIFSWGCDMFYAYPAASCINKKFYGIDKLEENQNDKKNE